MNSESTYYKITSAAGAYCTVATCFFIPLSTSLLGICSVLAFLFWLLSGQPRQLPTLMRENPVILYSTALFLLFIIGMGYSPVPLEDAARILAKYRELIFIPMVFCLLLGRPKEQKLAENAFVLGCTLLLVISYAIYFKILPEVKYGNSIIHHISHSFFMAMLGFWALQRSIDSERYKAFWISLLIAAVINLIFLNHGRSGMLIFLILAFLTLAQRCSLKTMLVGMVLLAGLITGTYYSSKNVQTRVADAIEDIDEYRPGRSRTSLGMRFDWWVNSVEMIKTAPLTGHGTGSFKKVQKEIKKKKTRRTDNPHNEYLFIGAQLGCLGLFTFIALLSWQLVWSRRLAVTQKFLAQGVVTAMAAGCLVNSFLFDSQQGHFYAFLSALLMASDGQLE